MQNVISDDKGGKITNFMKRNVLIQQNERRWRPGGNRK
jgi:hypothetical protein